MTTTKLAYENYACIAGEPELLGTRCQHSAIENSRCVEHQDEVQFPPAARPTRVLVKLNIPERMISSDLMRIVEGWKYKSWSKSAKGQRTLDVQSTVTGRNKFEYRQRVGDTGAEVFCGKGAVNIFLTADLMNDIFSQVGGMASLKLMQKSNNKAYLLQLEFRSDIPRSEILDNFAEYHEEILELLGLTWGETRIFCNLPLGVGVGLATETVQVSHTVNCATPRPKGTKPRGQLIYAGGDWEVLPIAEDEI